MTLILAAGCEEKPLPSDPENNENGGGQKDPPEIVDPPKDVPLHEKFTEDFSDTASEFFTFNYRTTRDDFRYFSGFPSLSEKKTKILMLRIDPSDAAGAGRGPEIISKDHTSYGTYSTRLKLPDIRKVQPNIGGVVGYSVYDNDERGLIEIYFEWLIANPAYFNVGIRTGDEAEPDETGKTIDLSAMLSGFDASARFYTYGFDWSQDHVSWWILHPDTGEKIVVWDLGEGIPAAPARYKTTFWHSKIKPAVNIPTSVEAPKYPFELEVDRMTYEPFDE